jgi:hypothetical protein
VRELALLNQGMKSFEALADARTPLFPDGLARQDKTAARALEVPSRLSDLDRAEVSSACVSVSDSRSGGNLQIERIKTAARSGRVPRTWKRDKTRQRTKQALDFRL